MGHTRLIRNILTAFALSLVTSGCGAVIKSRYYKPSLPGGSQFDSKEWGNGLAVTTGDVCVWVSERGTAYHQMVSEGPLGLPLIPNDLSSQLPGRSPVVAFEIWLTVDKDYAGYAISSKNITLIYSDGTERIPETIHMDRIKTKWEQPYFHILPTKNVEHLDQIEAVKPDTISNPVDLWNWTRINISFSRPTATAIPELLRVHGLQKNGSEIEVPAFQLKDIETTNYQVAGSFESPADPCRDLFNKRKSQ